MPQNNKPGRRLLRQLYGSWYRVRHNISIFARWCLFAVIIGVVVGAVGAAFEHALEWATETRQEQSWTLYFLPLVGVFIAFWYSKMDMPLERGTNFILTSVRQGFPHDYHVRYGGVLFGTVRHTACGERVRNGGYQRGRDVLRGAVSVHPRERDRASSGATAWRRHDRVYALRCAGKYGCAAYCKASGVRRGLRRTEYARVHHLP